MEGLRPSRLVVALVVLGGLVAGAIFGTVVAPRLGLVPVNHLPVLVIGEVRALCYAPLGAALAFAILYLAVRLRQP